MRLIDFYEHIAIDDKPIDLFMPWKAVSKERPRKGASGHMYTPKRTRDFEKLVGDVAKTIARPAFTCPVVVRIIIMEPVPKSYKGIKREAATSGLISPPVGDLDNKVKAITDGLNGIAYLDDNQINRIIASRLYGDRHSISVTIRRNGLSAKELEDYGQLRYSGGSA